MSSVLNIVNLAEIHKEIFTQQYVGRPVRNAETGQVAYPALIYRLRLRDVKLQAGGGASCVPSDDDWLTISDLFGKTRQLNNMHPVSSAFQLITGASSDNFIDLITDKKPVVNGDKGSRFYVNVNTEFFAKLASKFPTMVLRIKGSLRATLAEGYGHQFNGATEKAFDSVINCSDTARMREPIHIFETFAANGGGQDPITIACYVAPQQPLGYSCRQRFHLHLNCSIGLEWKNVKPECITLSSNLIVSGLYKDESTKDFSIVAGNGAIVKCHGLILSGQSEVFSSMINPSSKMMESQTKTIKMEYLSEQSVKLLVRYLYGLPLPIKDEDLSCDGALELLQAASLCELAHLSTSLQQIICEKEVKWFPPDTTLELYFFVKKIDSARKLQNRLLAVMNKTNASIRNCKKFLELSKTDGFELVWQLYDLK